MFTIKSCIIITLYYYSMLENRKTFLNHEISFTIDKHLCYCHGLDVKCPSHTYMCHYMGNPQLVHIWDALEPLEGGVQLEEVGS